MQIKVFADRIVFGGVGLDSGIVVIPSKLYPLARPIVASCPYEVFTRANTMPVTDPAVIACMDGMQYLLGQCFSNSENLTNLLVATGISDVQQYCGWLFIGDDYPVYHSWVVIGGKYVIDLAADTTDEEWKRHCDVSPDQLPDVVNKEMLQKLKLKNSVRCRFGSFAARYAYVGTPCSAAEGRTMLREVLAMYPHHPSLVV